ncbi:hypothetical protein DXT77_04925 [Pseudomonas sp. 91RF]|jgi:hypothetical protein|uniref:hypothetical protein n=1 Tax=Pseudomonas sp. 91RF TaxID=2292261 RepID=UPI000E66B5E8|nr:hypothetical protein [Pseudomonas sp. 91RF]RIJ12341.1 hypothetical protein DXT77_04925 [Pseudomonas sp. 91RF]
MKMKLHVVIAIIYFVLANVAFADPHDVYSADVDARSLIVTWSGGSKTIKDVIGSQGETTRELVDFNGGKALHYENLASRAPFEAYFTLTRHGAEVFIDCVYTNVRNEQNGILINKAVCGLERPLAEEYEEVASEFSDQWKNLTNKVAITPLLATPPVSVEVEESVLDGVKLSRTYHSPNDLKFSRPESVVKKDKFSHSFGDSYVFSVYTPGDLINPLYLDVSSGKLDSVFVRYDRAGIDKFF